MLDGIYINDEIKKKSLHLYFCKKCIRSFGSKNQENICRFCGSDVAELNKNNGKRQLYRFYCPVCYKSSVSYNNINSCPKCGNKILHVYPTERIWKREFLSIRKNEIINRLKFIFMKFKN